MLLPTYNNDHDSTSKDLLDHVDRLKHFLATAPARWQAQATPAHHPALNRFLLPSGEYVSCILWSGLYHITGTDIVRALVFRFEAFGRPVRNLKKFEEGVFSDLRNLKPGQDASLEEPKVTFETSPFLDLLFKYQCIRTQKKQKVFYWFSVPHDRLFLDALERDLKRERAGLEPTTVIVGEPAASFWYDPKRSLHEQFSQFPGHLSFNDTTTATQGSLSDPSATSAPADIKPLADDDCPVLIGRKRSLDEADGLMSPSESSAHRSLPHAIANPVLSPFSLFGGAANYKRRRGKIARLSEHGQPQEHGLLGNSNSDLGDLPDLRECVQTAPMAEEQDLLEYDSRITDITPDAPIARAVPAAPMHPFAFEDHQPLPALHADVVVARTAPFGGKSFSCPLFSCGRLFKRMEHLKRHLRTHTMERPYECTLCHKRFSRSDNLNQHLRTHSRGSSGDIQPQPRDEHIYAPASEPSLERIVLSVEAPLGDHAQSMSPPSVMDSPPSSQWLGPPIVTQHVYGGFSPDSCSPSPTTTGPPVTPAAFRGSPGLGVVRPMSASAGFRPQDGLMLEQRAASEPYRHSWSGDVLPEYVPHQKQDAAQGYPFATHSPMSSYGSAGSSPEYVPYGEPFAAYAPVPVQQAHCFPMDVGVHAPEMSFSFAA